MSDSPIRFVYFGTPQFAKTILEELRREDLTPILIVTAPDKPKGRHLHLAPSEVRVWGEAHGIPVITPLKLDDEVLGKIRALKPDMLVVAAYGKILPQSLLDIPPKGTLNVHPSLLPKFRGSSPIESSILSNEHGTGVTIMLLDAQLDHGPILAQRMVPVSPWPPKGSVLTDLLAREGGKLLADTMRGVASGTISPVEQDHTKATFTKKISKADGEIDPSGDPETTYKKFCAYDEWPGIYFFAARKNGGRVRVTVKDASFDGKTLVIHRVVPEGKKEMPYEDFLRGL